MKLFIRPIANKNGSIVNSENILCHQIVFTAVFSSRRGITTAPAWLDIDLLSGLANNEVWIRTDLICRASNAYQQAHRGGNLLTTKIVKIPTKVFVAKLGVIMNHLFATWSFKLSWKKLKKAHQTLCKMALAASLQPT